MEMADTKRLKELEKENSELKKMIANDMLKNCVLEDSLKKVESGPAKKRIVKELSKQGACSARQTGRSLSLAVPSLHYRVHRNSRKKKLVNRIIALGRKYPR